MVGGKDGRDGAAALGDEHGDLSVIAHRAVPGVVLPVERDLVDLAAHIDGVLIIRRLAGLFIVGLDQHGGQLCRIDFGQRHRIVLAVGHDGARTGLRLGSLRDGDHELAVRVLLVKLEHQLLCAAARNEREALVAGRDGVEAGGLIERAEHTGERLPVRQLVDAAGIRRTGLDGGEHRIAQRRVRDKVQRQEQIKRAGIECDLAVLTHEEVPFFIGVLRILDIQAPAVCTAGFVRLRINAALAVAVGICLGGDALVIFGDELAQRAELFLCRELVAAVGDEIRLVQLGGQGKLDGRAGGKRLGPDHRVAALGAAACNQHNDEHQQHERCGRDQQRQISAQPDALLSSFVHSRTSMIVFGAAKHEDRLRAVYS